MDHFSQNLVKISKKEFRTLKRAAISVLILKTISFMNGPIFWDITSCSPLKVNWRFGGTARLLLQGQLISQGRNQHERGNKQDPEDMFPRNVS
jgi:hypothetical protein